MFWTNVTRKPPIFGEICFLQVGFLHRPSLLRLCVLTVTCEHACCPSGCGFGFARTFEFERACMPPFLGFRSVRFLVWYTVMNLSDSGISGFSKILFLVPVGFLCANNMGNSSAGSGFDCGLKVTRNLQQYPGFDHVRIVNMYTRWCWRLWWGQIVGSIMCGFVFRFQ
ncbi:unnamed protein product, partial [Sphacelaria rigidula]